MSLADAFLCDIADHPADDAPRLIFADWLDENGETARAELIRVQCRLAHLSDDEPEQRRLRAREKSLLDLHEAVWRKALPALEEVAWHEFHRGFVDAVWVDSADAFLAHAPTLFASAPIQRVQIGRIDRSSGRHLAESLYLARLIELNLGNHTGLSRESLCALAQSPHVERLESLLLHYNDLGDEGIDFLDESSHLGQLRELYLSGNELGDESAVALGSSGRFPLLTDLDLRDNLIEDLGAQGLASSVGLDRLASLWLVNNRIGEAGVAELAKTKRLPALSYLFLNYNPIRDAGAAALAASPHRNGLVELDLRHCEISDRGGLALAASPYLDQLRILWLGGNRFGTETLTRLRRRFGERLRI